MKGGHGRRALFAAALCAGAVGPLALGALGPGSGAALAALQPKVVLPQAVPSLPAGTAHLGAAPSGQVLDLDVALAGQNPSGLAQAVAAVSTPGSPDYHHYLTASQFATEFGPSAAEVAQVSSALRSEGLTVGTPAPGSILLPVHGTAAVVSAAFATPLEQVQAPNGPRAVVNTSSPAVPSTLSGLVTGVAGLDGLFSEHSNARQSPTPGSGAPAAPSAAPATGATTNTSHAVAHAGTPQACSAAAASAPSGSGIYTSSPDGEPVRPQPAVRAGPHRRRPDDRHRRVRAVLLERLPHLPVLLRPRQSHPQRDHRRRPRRPERG